MKVGAGTVLGDRYRLLERVGAGGMGEVWAAEHTQLGTRLAVKLIKPALLGDHDAVSRFEREARAAAVLRSTHIVQVIDFGVEDGLPYLALEWLEGETLRERLAREGKLSAKDTLEVIAQVAVAIGHAHDRGLVHRDIKPDNVFLVEEPGGEVVKLLDFGIAKSLRDDRLSKDAPETATGAVLGTPYYMSPEQVVGARDVGPASDLWALGILTFECLIGARPFRSTNPGQVMVQICHEELALPSVLAPHLPGLDAWFAMATARDSRQRFQSARELVEGLAEALDLPSPRFAKSQRSSASNPGTPLAEQDTLPTPPSDSIAEQATELAETPRAVVTTASWGARALVAAGLAGAIVALSFSVVNSPDTVPSATTLVSPSTVPSSSATPQQAGPALRIAGQRALMPKQPQIFVAALRADGQLARSEGAMLHLPERKKPLELEGPVASLDWFPDRRRLLVNFSSPPEVKVLDTREPLKPLHKLAEGGLSTVSPDGTHVAFARGTSVWLIGTDGANRRRWYSGNQRIDNIAWAPNSKAVAIVEGGSEEPGLHHISILRVGSEVAAARSEGGELTNSGGESALIWPTDEYLVHGVLRGSSAHPVFRLVSRRVEKDSLGPMREIAGQTAVEWFVQRSVGKRILAISEDHHYEVVTTRLGRGEPKSISGTLGSNRFGGWLGNTPLITSSRDGAWNAYLVEPGGELSKLTDGSSDVWYTDPEPIDERRFYVWKTTRSGNGTGKSVLMRQTGSRREPVYDHPPRQRWRPGGRPPPLDATVACGGGVCLLMTHERKTATLRELRDAGSAGPVIAEVTPRALAPDLAISPDGAKAALSSTEGGVTLVTLATGEKRHFDTTLAQYAGFARGGSSLFVTGIAPEGCMLHRLDLSSGELTLVRSGSHWLAHPSVAPDGETLGLTHKTHAYQLWELTLQ